MIIGAILKRKLALLGLIVIAVFALAAILAPWIAPYDPTASPGDFALPPNAQFWLGTDLLGRDLLFRLIYGARATLIIGVVANGVAVAIGALLGVTAGISAAMWAAFAHALYRSDDGFSGFASGHPACRHVPAEPMDRRPGHRHGQLGADCARGLCRDDLAGRA